MEPNIEFYPVRDQKTGQPDRSGWWWLEITHQGLPKKEILGKDTIRTFIRRAKAGDYDWILNERS